VRLRVFLAVSLVSLAIYVVTSSPTVGPVDSGELTLAVWGLDIAHPPGFPLYTLLGWLATHLAPCSPARAANLLSAICAAAAAGAVGVILTRFVRSSHACIAAALCFSLGRSPWSWATVAEVYALQSLLLACTLALLTGTLSGRTHAMAGYLVGLSLANHLGTAVSVLPALLLMAPLVGIAVPVGFLILGLSTYLYVPARCAAGPLFNWGNACTLRRFIWHVTGKQYQVNLSLDPVQMVRELAAFWSALVRQYPPLLLALVAVGVVLFARRHRRASVALLVLVVGNILYCAMYSIGQDKDAYYIPSFMVLAVPLGTTMAALAQRLPRKASAAVLAVPVVLAIVNFSSQNRGRFALARDYALDALASVGDKGLLLTSDWQVYAPMLCLQEIEGCSPGIASVDVLLLRRTWYLDYITRKWPALATSAGRALAVYRALLYRFEYGLAYDPAAIQRAYVNLINALAQSSVAATGGPACLMGPMDQGVGAGWGAVPRGIAERLAPLGHPVHYEEIPLRLDTVLGKDPSRTEVGDHIRRHYARALLRQAAVLQASGAVQQAQEKQSLAQRLSPPSGRQQDISGSGYQ
jgi:hypothetical protein